MDVVRELDIKDRKILFALEQNARQANIALGKEVGLPPDVVQYRIDRLIDRGVLKFFLGYINFAKLGFVDYGLYLSTQRMSKAQEQEFIKFLTSHPYCPYFCRSGGTYNFVADMLARDPISLMELVTDLTNKFGASLYRREIVTRIHATHFAKQYLLDASKAPEPSTYFGGTTSRTVKIDENDDQILRMLGADARVRLIDIAQQIGLSSTAVAQRVKRLEEARLITGYFAWIEPQSFGYQSFNLLLKQQNLQTEDEKRLFEFCRVHRHVVWLIKTLGPWDFEIAVEVKSQERLQQVVDELYDKFSEVIQSIEFAPIFRTFKYTQFPFTKNVKVWQDSPR